MCVLISASCGSSGKVAGLGAAVGGATTTNANVLTEATTSVAVSDCDASPLVDPATSSRLSWPLLKRGDVSDRVVAFQYLLIASGMDVVADGDFGGATEEALMTFQRNDNQPETGIVSPHDWLSLVRGCAQERSDDRVRALQVALSLPGYAQAITGKVDALTTANLKQSRIDSGSRISDSVNVADWLMLVGVGD